MWGDTDKSAELFVKFRTIAFDAKSILRSLILYLQIAVTTTIGMSLRALRAIFNIAKKDGIITDEQYPFGRNKYQIPEGRNIKKACINP
jgi:hypothetical protein